MIKIIFTCVLAVLTILECVISHAIAVNIINKYGYEDENSDY